MLVKRVCKKCINKHRELGHDKAPWSFMEERDWKMGFVTCGYEDKPVKMPFFGRYSKFLPVETTTHNFRNGTIPPNCKYELEQMMGMK